MNNTLTIFYRRLYRRWIYAFISVSVAFSLCLFIPQPSLGISIFDIIQGGMQIIQLSNVSTEQEISLGQEINQQLINSDIKLYKDPVVNAYVDKIGQRLARTSTRPTLPFKFQIVEDDAINAFATMGGFVYVHTGLLKTAANEAELASVIGHEIGHITGRHALKQMKQTAIAKGLASVVGADRNQVVQIGVELAFKRPRSRKDELDADQRGLQNLKASGYPQSAMVSFMQKLMAASGSSSTPSILSTHPATKDRITAIKRTMDPSSVKFKDGLDTSSYKQNIRNLR
jgi:beta-barrel assembly-enhancing protease